MNVAILTGNNFDSAFENARLIEELKLLHCDVEIIDYQQSSVLDTDADTGLQIVSAGEILRTLPHVVIPRINEPDLESITKARRFLDVFAALDIPSTLSSGAMDICKDKMSTHDKLVAAGVPTPRTAMPTSVEATDIVPLLEYIEPNPNRPVVIKKVHGTKGIGVARAGTRRSALPFIQMLVDSNIPILAQQYIETKRNGNYRDIRHVVVGGMVVAAMLRQSSNDFRTNLSLNSESNGGISDARGRATRVSALHRELSIGAAEAVGATIAGVDILPSIHKGAYVDDINVSPGFRVETITNRNVAGTIARYAVLLASTTSK